MEIKIKRFEKAILYQVITMDEEFRGKGNMFTHNYVTISSHKEPEICTYATVEEMFICIGGKDKNSDDKIAILRFQTNRQRDKTYHKMVKAFMFFNKHLKEEYNELHSESSFEYDAEEGFMRMDDFSIKIETWKNSVVIQTLDCDDDAQSCEEYVCDKTGWSINRQDSHALYLYNHRNNSEPVILNRNKDIQVLSFKNQQEAELALKEIVDTFYEYDLESRTVDLNDMEDVITLDLEIAK